MKEQAAELRDDKQFAIGAVEAAIAHGLIGDVDVNAQAAVRGGIAVDGEGDEAVDEIGLRWRGMGIGSQRNWLGVVATSSQGAVRSSPREISR